MAARAADWYHVATATDPTRGAGLRMMARWVASATVVRSVRRCSRLIRNHDAWAAKNVPTTMTMMLATLACGSFRSRKSRPEAAATAAAPRTRTPAGRDATRGQEGSDHERPGDVDAAGEGQVDHSQDD